MIDSKSAYEDRKIVVNEDSESPVHDVPRVNEYESKIKSNFDQSGMKGSK